MPVSTPDGIAAASPRGVVVSVAWGPHQEQCEWTIMDHVIDFNVAGFLVLNELSVKYQKSIKIDIRIFVCTTERTLSPNNAIYWKRVRHSVVPAILIPNSSIEFPQVPAPRRSKESCSACSRRRTDSTWRSIEAGVACENKYSHWNSHHTLVVKGSASAYVCYYAVQLKLLVFEDALFPHGSLVTSWGG